MDATTLFIVGLFLLLACAVFVGELVGRLGVLPLVGQFAVGLIFGPTLFGPILGLSGLNAEFQGVQVLATFFVLLAAGLTVTPEQLRNTGAASAALGGAVFVGPFAAGIVVIHALYPTLPLLTVLFVSVTISISALPVLGIMLQELGLLPGRFGTFLLNGALVNEFAAVTAYAILLRVRDGSGHVTLDVSVAVAAVALFVATILVAERVLRHVRNSSFWTARRSSGTGFTWRSREAGFAVLVVAALASALYSQFLGLTFVIGAFYAGLLISPEIVGRPSYRAITQVFDTITWGFFIPLFCALAGLGMNLRLVGNSLDAVLAFAALCVFAFGIKVAFGGVVTSRLGWGSRESWGAGLLLASRGAVEIAMALVLLSIGVFTVQLFTIVAGVAIVTTFVSPVLARPMLASVPRLRSRPPAADSRYAVSVWRPPDPEPVAGVARDP